MRTTISIVCLLGSIGIALWIITKATLTGIAYITGFFGIVFLSFLSGQALQLTQPQPNTPKHSLLDELKVKLELLIKEWEAGKNSAPQVQPQITPQVVQTSKIVPTAPTNPSTSSNTAQPAIAQSTTKKPVVKPILKTVAKVVKTEEEPPMSMYEEDAKLYM